MEAFQRPVLGHLDPDFLVVLDEIGDRLRAAFRTANALTLPISGTGSAGHGGVLRQPARAGRHRDHRRQRRVRRAHVRGRAPVRRRGRARRRAVGTRDRSAAAARRAARASRRARCSRSCTRRRRPASRTRSRRSPRCSDTDTLLLVDTVTSLGGIPVEVDAWGIDAVYSGTQKCLGVPPGLVAGQLLGARGRARSQPRRARRSRGTSTSALIADYVGTARRYHHTAPISMLYALHAGLGVAARRRARSVVGAARAGRRAAPAARCPSSGSGSFAQERRLPQLTSVWLPDGVDDAKVRGELLAPLRHRGRRRARRARGQGLAHRPHGPPAREQSVTTLLGALAAARLSCRRGVGVGSRSGVAASRRAAGAAARGSSAAPRSTRGCRRARGACSALPGRFL